MFGYYALPTDDEGGNGTATGSAEDTGYPASNLLAPTNTGHLNLPARPAKLTTTTGYFDITLSSAATIIAIAVIYHNFLEGLDVTFESGATTVPIIIPAKPNALDDWTISPWATFDPITASTFRLSINSANDQPIQVGRLLLLSALREMETDVRYGGEEQEERIVIADPTELGVETMYDFYNVQRRFNGSFGFRPDETAALRALWRSARNRVLPWLLIPDQAVNDAWLVRFEDVAFSRVHSTIDFNEHPFRVRELSRGLPWP